MMQVAHFRFAGSSAATGAVDLTAGGAPPAAGLAAGGASLAAGLAASGKVVAGVVTRMRSSLRLRGDSAA